MCATFNIDESTLKRLLEKYPTVLTRANNDVYPTDTAVVITDKSPMALTWGFTRFDSKGVLINARAETVTQKRMFDQSFMSSRCVVPANGFYEWDEQKRRHYFVRADGEPALLCGFWREEADGARFIILTKSATSPVDEYHDRIPVITDIKNSEAYLSDPDYARSFITKPTDIALTAVN